MSHCTKTSKPFAIVAGGNIHVCSARFDHLSNYLDAFDVTCGEKRHGFKLWSYGIVRLNSCYAEAIFESCSARES